MAGGVSTSTPVDAPIVAGRVRVDVADWAAAVRAAAQLLVDAGAATATYADRCVQIVREQGPYIVIAPGLALAHARPEDGAQALALSAVTLATPVRFGHATNDPVDLVLAFASPDRDMHIGLLAVLARRLGDGLPTQLRTAPSDDAAVALLQEVVDDVGQPVR
jgi:PTS system ascorbate-specific IIA component